MCPRAVSYVHPCYCFLQLRHPNILAFKDSIEVQEKGQHVVYLVTEAVRPLITVLKELNLSGKHRQAAGIMHGRSSCITTRATTSSSAHTTSRLMCGTSHSSCLSIHGSRKGLHHLNTIMAAAETRHVLTHTVSHAFVTCRDEYLATGVLHMTNAVSFLNNSCNMVRVCTAATLWNCAGTAAATAMLSLPSVSS